VKVDTYTVCYEVDNITKSVTEEYEEEMYCVVVVSVCGLISGMVVDERRQVEILIPPKLLT